MVICGSTKTTPRLQNMQYRTNAWHHSAFFHHLFTVNRFDMDPNLFETDTEKLIHNSLWLPFSCTQTLFIFHYVEVKKSKFESHLSHSPVALALAHCLAGRPPKYFHCPPYGKKVIIQDFPVYGPNHLSCTHGRNTPQSIMIPLWWAWTWSFFKGVLCRQYMILNYNVPPVVFLLWLFLWPQLWDH